MNQYKENSPTADVLMLSMRAMGYSFESAVADIIDNSISADAKNIRILFPIDPSNCFLAVCDDGTGMSSGELFDAMKYGSERKREGRAENDLGRFGLGLKSASLSQCRKLTVISKKNGDLSAYIWNLDVIEKERGWYIIECADDAISQMRFALELKDLNNGTVVIWENFDLIEKTSGSVYAELSKYQETTANYLSLIFHRFLNKSGSDRIHIWINNYELSGFDPFLESHKKTNIRRKIEIPVTDADGVERIVTVQPYVLPFQKDLSKEDQKKSGGIENYRARQGFYIYRNERLIVWGNWFGRHRDELTKYARIKVDIPNTLDDIWGIDIKKQSARIPPVIRNRLTRAVDEAMDIAIKAQTYRGRIEKVDEGLDYIWDRIKERDQFSYKINRDSRVFDLIKDKVDDETWARIDMVLEEVEESIPYQQIYIDKSQNRIDDTINDERYAEIKAKAKILIDIALSMGDSTRQQVIERMFVSEPFSKYPELKQSLLEEST